MDRVPLSDTEAERSLLCEGDLLFARQSLVLSGAGKCSIFLGDTEPVCFESHIIRVRIDTKKANPTYLYYFFQSPSGRASIHSIVEQGAGASGIRGSDLAYLQFHIPDLGIQRAIAYILGTLDDKIELNRRMNETLEAMARALFKSWFVDFDPVRAKMEGRDTGLPQHLSDLFPDRLADSELGGIPEGWTVQELGDVADQRRSGAKPGEINPDTPYIALQHMPKFSIALSEWATSDGLASSKFRFERGDILFGKLRPYFHKVGVAALDGVCSTDIVVVSPTSPDWFGFVLGHTSSPEFVDYTDAVSTGTRMPRTKWADMARFKIAMPNGELPKTFTGLVQPWVNRIVSAIHESRSLAAQRDVLLPKLVSGEVRAE